MNAGSNLKPEDLLEILPFIEPLNKDAIRRLAKEKLGIGINKVDGLLNELESTERISIAISPRPRTRPERKYVRTRDPHGHN